MRRAEFLADRGDGLEGQVRAAARKHGACTGAPSAGSSWPSRRRTGRSARRPRPSRAPPPRSSSPGCSCALPASHSALLTSHGPPDDSHTTTRRPALAKIRGFSGKGGAVCGVWNASPRPAPRSLGCGSSGRPGTVPSRDRAAAPGDGYDQALAAATAIHPARRGRAQRPRAAPGPDAPGRVPERATLDGLEQRWSEVWEREGTYAFDRSAPRERVFAIDTPPPTVSGSLHVGHVFSFTHTDTIARYPADARARGLLPDGLGRQRPADRAPRAEPLRRALRPLGGLRPRLRAARPASAPEREPVAGLAPELRRALPAPDRERRAGLRGAVAQARAVGRLVDDLHDDRRARAAHLPALVPRPAGARRGLPARGADAVGRRLPDRGRAGRARGPRASRARCTACASRSRPTAAAARR